jgi:hypothetical protein
LTAAGAGPSWLDRARAQTASDVAAYQAGGVPQLMEQTASPMGLAGGFGGSIKGVGGPIRAYHGSPYDFERFDLSKVGTGEGAQAYGHGLYFAENPAVAADYRNRLAQVTSSDRPNFFLPSGEMFWPEKGTTALAIRQRLEDIVPKEGTASAQDIARAFSDERQMLANTKGPMKQILSDNLDNFQQELKSTGAFFRNTKPPGKMYEVNINAAPEQFLNWDRPLSRQDIPTLYSGLQASGSPQVSAYAKTWEQYPKDYTGEDVYRALQNKYGRGSLTFGKPEASETLQQAGIPGIRYLDQLSRGGGQGTSNYVVFNPDIIDIIRKYGLAGAVTPAGVLMGAGQPAQPQQQ